MKHVTLLALVCMTATLPGTAMSQDMPAGKTFTLSAQMLNGYQGIMRNLVEAAEKMPEDQYAFRPTPEVRPFGQIVAHIALSQYGACTMFKNEPNPHKDDKEDAARTKAEAVSLLKASIAYCDPLVSGIDDAAMTTLTKAGANQAAKGLLPASLLSHGQETYGTMVVYLRLKGIVPPSTERMNQMSKSEPKKSE